MTTVLVIDDNARNRKLARDVLGAAGFEILEAATGAEGIALAGEHVPDVILMDLRLTDMGGAEVAQRLKQMEPTASVPVVATSAQPLEGSAEWLQASGFAGWIEKPIQVQAFPEQVRRFCSEARG